MAAFVDDHEEWVQVTSSSSSREYYFSSSFYSPSDASYGTQLRTNVVNHANTDWKYSTVNKNLGCHLVDINPLQTL
jgi:hypothetical protein